MGNKTKTMTQQQGEALYELSRLAQALANLCTAAYCLRNASKQAGKSAPRDGARLGRLANETLAVAHRWATTHPTVNPVTAQHLTALGLRYPRGHKDG